MRLLVKFEGPKYDRVHTAMFDGPDTRTFPVTGEYLDAAMDSNAGFRRTSAFDDMGYVEVLKLKEIC